MAIQLTNKIGQIDLAMIDPEEVAKLTDPQQEALSILIDAVKAREAATERQIKATVRVYAAVADETEKLAEYIKANPPQSEDAARRAAIDAYNRSHA
jgi:hypothetical protein